MNTNEYTNLLFDDMKNVNDFKNDLDVISKTWEQLILLSQLGSTNIDISDTRTDFVNLTEELISNLTDETLDKVIHEMKAKSQVVVDIVIRNLYERTADIGFLATDDDIRNFLFNINDFQKRLSLHKNDKDDTQYRIINSEYKKSKNQMKSRFKEYVDKYSVYYDVVLFDNSGNIIATLDETKNITKTNDIIFELSKNTKDDFIETYKYHDFLPNDEKSLVYTYKVTKTNEDDTIVGYLSLCFKFENEMADIFTNLINTNNKEVLLLLDSTGQVIATSDKYHIPVGAPLEIEIKEDLKIVQFAGRDYICKTSKTNGYEGFYGLGWNGHIMIPINSAFNVKENNLQIDDNILHSIMQNKKLFKEEFLKIPIKANLIQKHLDRAVWNGNINQTAQSTDKSDFARSILREVRLTGEKTKQTFNNSIEKLNYTIITSSLEKVSFLSSLAMNIMDRNLYERANDVRWWALTSKFKRILEKDVYDDTDKNNITSILEYINGLYTVYTNLFIYDKNGVIIAVSNQNDNNLIGTSLTQEWKTSTLKIKDSSKYTVSQFERTSLYNNLETYIYGSSITNTQNSEVVGGIGIVFDSKPQFTDILKDTLPKKENNIDSDTFGLFVEKSTHKIISSCSDNHIVGDLLNLDSGIFDIENGESKSKIIEYRDKYYFIGITCSFGYREYKSDNDEYKNDVLSMIFIEAGNTKNIVKKDTFMNNISYNYESSNDVEYSDIATFYIEKKWLGIKQEDIVEAISIKELESSINMNKDHHFKGMVIYKDTAVSILDISAFVKEKTVSKHTEIVIVNYEGSEKIHTIGILVHKLGEILHVPNQQIKSFEEHLIGGGTLIESIIQPPKGVSSDTLLTLLNISKLNNLKEDIK